MEKEVYGLFNDSYPPVLDGVTTTVVNYARRLVESGRRVCVVTPWNPFDPAHPDYEMHRYFSLPIFGRRPYRYGYPRLDPLIWMKIRRKPFRIVHAHCPFSSGRLARYSAKYHNIPLVATFHSKYRTDLQRSLPPFMLRYQMERIKRFYNEAYEVWIPQAAVEETVREYGITAPVKVVDNGTDLYVKDADIEKIRRLAREKMSIPPSKKVLLFVGQHILEKGIQVVVDALKEIEAHSLLDWEMHFVGDGYAREDTVNGVNKLGLADKVHFHGVVNDREKLSQLYAIADLFLFPSFYDNAPLVVREAACLGTPSLLLAGSTAAEHVKDGFNGFLTSRDGDSYAKAIVALVSDRQKLLDVAKNARETMCRSWDDVVDEVISRYDEIIQRYEREHNH